jgi:hypothetical protein
MGRSLREVLADRLLLIWLLYDALSYKKFGDTKAHKLTYLSELDMIDNREKGFNYDFIKMPYGPYSEQLQKDIVWLEEQKLIESVPIDEGKLFQKSHFGIKLLDDFHDLFLRNNLFTIKIHRINSVYAPKNSRQLVDLVHGFPHPYIKGKTINDLKNGTIILYKLVDEKAKVQFNITPEELATLDIYLDDENYRSVTEASESAKRKPLLNIDEVF